MSKPDNSNMPFNRVNYIMMAVCMAMIVIGFLLMSGGSSASAVDFNPEIFSTRRLVVGPAIAFAGFVLMAFAIIWKPRKKTPKSVPTQIKHPGD